MPSCFLRGDRDQPFLLPPDLRDWLPEGHLAWFVVDVVDQLDLQPFYRAHRDDRHGHPAYDPTLLLGVLLSAYAIGVRSSRQIERRCHDDIAVRVLAGNQTPDHVTIARFRVRHETALAGFLLASLTLCAAAGMVRVGTAPSTAPSSPAAPPRRPTAPTTSSKARSPRSCGRPPRPTSATTASTAPRGDELPAELASKAGRLQRLRVATALLEAKAAERQRRHQQRVAELAAAARARGKQPRAHSKPRARRGAQPQAGRQRHRPRQPPGAHPARVACRATTARRSPRASR
jgi:transposase